MQLIHLIYIIVCEIVKISTYDIFSNYYILQ